eukprot:TRINITY_DN4605_c0_g1_i1.p2 TRINITY_DN4605_c0_g1~~TRINITY_DN4605_c0_g1_i1.p2  ORF type:complete len:52 (+),score=0.21 TRINITY_DN4605_c0_g1_i1:205-360(+)
MVKYGAPRRSKYGTSSTLSFTTPNVGALQCVISCHKDNPSIQMSDCFCEFF